MGPCPCFRAPRGGVKSRVNQGRLQTFSRILSLLKKLDIIKTKDIFNMTYLYIEKGF
jgi:hypothetical protein